MQTASAETKEGMSLAQTTEDENRYVSRNDLCFRISNYFGIRSHASILQFIDYHIF